MKFPDEQKSAPDKAEAPSVASIDEGQPKLTAIKTHRWKLGSGVNDKISMNSSGTMRAEPAERPFGPARSRYPRLNHSGKFAAASGADEEKGEPQTDDCERAAHQEHDACIVARDALPRFCRRLGYRTLFRHA